MGLDRSVLPTDSLRQHHQHRESGNFRVRPFHVQGVNDCGLFDSGNCTAHWRGFSQGRSCELHGVWRISSKWMEGCGAGCHFGTFQLLWNRSNGKYGGRSCRPEGGSTEGVAENALRFGALLRSRTGAGGRNCPMATDRPWQEPFRSRFRNRWHSWRGPHHESRRADGRAFQCRCQLVFRGAACFFTRARRLSSSGAWPIERKEHASGRGAGFGRGNGRCACAVRVL